MTFGDRFVVREDVVLVTVNHRLGALGYMYLGDVAADVVDGNPGMLDLVAALRWVRDNITAFVGDHDKLGTEFERQPRQFVDVAVRGQHVDPPRLAIAADEIEGRLPDRSRCTE